jgi:DNA-binding YbaB/EbfC family protein
MLRMQQEQESKTFTAKAGGGMVAATVNGKHELTALEINPEAVDPDDVDMLQDMIIAAVNEAMRTADSEAANNMSKLTGGLGGLGGLF